MPSASSPRVGTRTSARAMSRPASGRAGWARTDRSTIHWVSIRTIPKLARELAASLVTHGGFDPQDYADRVARLFTGGRIVGGGRTTAQAPRIARGTPWCEAGTPPPAAGNGSAM